MNRKSNLIVMLAVLIASACLASCVSFASKGLSFGRTVGRDEPVNRIYFSERVWMNKFLGSSAGATFVNVSQTNYDFLVADICRKVAIRYGGIGVEDVSVVHEASAGCILLNAITLGIYAPSEVVVSGYVIVPSTVQQLTTFQQPAASQPNASQPNALQ